MVLIDNILRAVFSHTYITQPGFVLEKFGQQTLRNVFLSESAIVNVENAVSKKNGEGILYGIGKEFGYNYAKAIPLPHSNFIFRDTVFRDLIRFFETTFGSCEYYQVDWNAHRVDVRLKDFIVCRKNGRGSLFQGAITGACAFIFNDKSLEGIQTACQGRGNDSCCGIIMPSNDFGKNDNPFRYPNIIETDIVADYAALNNIIPFESDYGLDVLGQIGLAKYKTSAFDILGERVFPMEISFAYSLEKKLYDNGFDLTKFVYAPVFEAFKKFGQDKLKQKYEKSYNALDFASKLFSALGWGIIQIKPQEKPALFVQGFPYTRELESLRKLNYFFGAIDGLLCGLTGRKFQGVASPFDKRQGHCDFTISF